MKRQPTLVLARVQVLPHFMITDRYLKLADHYNACLSAHGDTAKGADWPNQADRELRYEVMLSVMDDTEPRPVDLLDFACGTGDMLRHITVTNRSGIRYRGADISENALRLAREKFPGIPFTGIDVTNATDEEIAALTCDYCVINGLFTVKGELSDEEMWSFLTQTVSRLWTVTRRGIAFNVMSQHVDRRRDDLFHLSYDRVADFLHHLSDRRIAFRADYGLYEYTCFAFRDEPTAAHLALKNSRPDSIASGWREVCRPLLPDTGSLVPYLQSIDARRWYSNWGELNTSLEERLACTFALPERSVVTAGNGTDAITAAIIAVAGRATSEKPLCMMPSYTFVGTAAAAVNAGYTPYLLDIHEETFALDWRSVIAHPALERAGCLVVVAPYGRPVDATKYKSFTQETGVPVVIDAAAGFDAFASRAARVPDDIPVALSFHATKVFGTGEGGAILCTNSDLARKCQRALNFGFLGDRQATVPGLNGKLSEYHAAVGLAELDGWVEKRLAYLAAAEAYLSASKKHGIAGRIVAETQWASSYVLFEGESAATAEAVTRRLTAAGVDHRKWYGLGLHRHKAYGDCPADPLPVTDRVAPAIIGLPMSIDLTTEDINYVVAMVADALRSAATPPSSVA